MTSIPAILLFIHQKSFLPREILDELSSPVVDCIRVDCLVALPQNHRWKATDVKRKMSIVRQPISVDEGATAKTGTVSGFLRVFVKQPVTLLVEVS